MGFLRRVMKDEVFKGHTPRHCARRANAGEQRACPVPSGALAFGGVAPGYRRLEGGSTAHGPPSAQKFCGAGAARAQRSHATVTSQLCAASAGTQAFAKTEVLASLRGTTNTTVGREGCTGSAPTKHPTGTRARAIGLSRGHRRRHRAAVAHDVTRRRRRSAASASAPKATALGDVDAQSHALWGGGLPFASSPPPN